MRWLYKLEYKHGNRYIRNLMTIIVAGMAIVYLLDSFFAPSGVLVSSWLTLNSAAILSGQVWRLITFIFVYPNTGAIWLLISLYFYFIMGRMLEGYWGGFRLNVYYLCGIVGAILGTFLCHLLIWLLYGASASVTGSNQYLNLSLFLAFASISPDTEFRLFFILPIKAKWLILAYAVMLILPLVQTFLFSGFVSGLLQLILLAFSLLNYFLFFGGSLISSLKDQYRIAQNRRNWRNRNK